MAKLNYEFYSSEGVSASPAEIDTKTEERIKNFRNRQLGKLALSKF